VVREAPDVERVRAAFRRTVVRRQRHGDGTISLEGRRFEMPSRYGHLDRVHVRYATWDLTQVDLVDGPTGEVVCRLPPQDKAKNAEGLRRRREGQASSEPGMPLRPPASGMAPLLFECLETYRASDLPAAYLPLDEEEDDEEGRTS
jgi:putative transposase